MYNPLEKIPSCITANRWLGKVKVPIGYRRALMRVETVHVLPPKNIVFSMKIMDLCHKRIGPRKPYIYIYI